MPLTSRRFPVLGRRPRAAVALGLIAALTVGAAPRPGQARHHRSHKASESPSKAGGRHADTQEESQVAAAQQALTAGDVAGAYRTLEQAYRARPSAELLFWLGRVAEAERRTTAAQDYMRRFLLESGSDKNEAAGALRAQAQKLAEQSVEASAEARVVGPKGALLLVDERLAGTLPLPGPLLLAAGSHRVAIETKRRSLDGKLEIVAGRGVEVLFDFEASAVLVSQQPVVLVLRTDRGLAEGDQVKLGGAIREAFSKARCSPAQAGEALRVAPDFRGCLAELGCQLRLADKNGLDYALRLEIDSKSAGGGERSDVRISAAVLDVAVGAVAAQAERTCAGCAVEGTAAAVRDVVTKVLGDGLGRPRGALAIETAPPGAAVTIDGRLVGSSPLRRDVLAGEHTVEFAASGQKPATQRIRVGPSETKTLRVMLAEAPAEVEPVPSPPVPSLRARLFYPRPAWRLLAGGFAVGAGIILSGFGASALAVDGQCQVPAVAPMTTCGYLFSTGGLGGGLLGVGLVLTLGGAGLSLWPGSRPDQAKNQADSRGEPIGSLGLADGRLVGESPPLLLLRF